MQSIQAESFGLGWFWLHFSFAIHAFHVYVTATSLPKKSARYIQLHLQLQSPFDERPQIDVQYQGARPAALVVLPWIQEQTPPEGMHF
jgi:uncharacterized membrane protein